MDDLYTMSKADNIMYAKRCIVDSIYKQSRLEGIAVTFPETQEIYEGRSVSGLSVEDIIKVNNLKHGWQFIFDTIDYPLDLRYIRQINLEVGNGIVTDAGNLRTAAVSIGGTSWRPDIPDYQKAEDEINRIMQSDLSVTEKAMDLMLYVMRSQLFYDGNKRTAQIAANQIMIHGGAGILAVPVEKQPEFFTHLVCYYETGKAKDIKTFLYETSIGGFNKEITAQPPINKAQFSDTINIINSDGKPETITREALAMRILDGDTVQIIKQNQH
ncbi:Fic family protein [Mordavella massiliensis]|nr:Fic family protein [Mordavella massiliensis]